MGLAAFELICVLCQSLAPPAPAAPLRIDPSWLAQQYAFVVHDDAASQAVVAAAAGGPTTPTTEHSLGAQRSLGAGRELRLNLTPTPARCAPLVSVTF
jgi:hypothetical protein